MTKPPSKAPINIQGIDKVELLRALLSNSPAHGEKPMALPETRRTNWEVTRADAELLWLQHPDGKFGKVLGSKLYVDLSGDSFDPTDYDNYNYSPREMLKVVHKLTIKKYINLCDDPGLRHLRQHELNAILPLYDQIKPAAEIVAALRQSMQAAATADMHIIDAMPAGITVKTVPYLWTRVLPPRLDEATRIVQTALEQKHEGVSTAEMARIIARLCAYAAAHSDETDGKYDLREPVVRKNAIAMAYARRKEPIGTPITKGLDLEMPCNMLLEAPLAALEAPLGQMLDELLAAQPREMLFNPRRYYDTLYQSLRHVSEEDNMSISQAVQTLAAHTAVSPQAASR